MLCISQWTDLRRARADREEQSSAIARPGSGVTDRVGGLEGVINLAFAFEFGDLVATS